MSEPLDPELDEDAPRRPSRSRVRSEAVAYTQLAEQLVRGKRTELPMPPFDEDMLDALLESRRLTKKARSRQIRKFAQLLRGAGPIEQLREALEGRKAQAAEQQREQANETWRARLLGEGDPALTELIGEYPEADRKRLRQLMRQARRTPPDARSKRASTALLRLIRQTRASTQTELDEAEAGDTPESDESTAVAEAETEPEPEP